MKKLQLLQFQNDTTHKTNSQSLTDNNINSEYYSIYSENSEIIFLAQINSCESYKEHILSNQQIYHQNRNLNEYYKMIKLQAYLDYENRTKNNLIKHNVNTTDSSITISIETKDKLSENL